MKKVLFALPVLAFALFFSFCTKEQNQLSNAAADKAKAVATDRGGEGQSCCVTIAASGTVEVCGLSTNGVTCLDCYSVNRPGKDVGTNFTYNVVPSYPDTPFSIRNTGQTTVRVTVSTPAYGCAMWVLSPGECQQYGLATTCLLFSSMPDGPCQ